MKSRIRRHAGAVSSAHSEADEKYNWFMILEAAICESIASNTIELCNFNYATLYMPNICLLVVKFLWYP
jgi:hypothetical protein